MDYGTLLKNKDISNYLSHYKQDQWNNIIENVLEYGINEIENQKTKEKQHNHNYNQQRTISERQEQRKSRESNENNNSCSNANMNQSNHSQNQLQRTEAMLYKSLEKISKTSQYRGNRAEKRIDGKLDMLSDALDYIPYKIKNERAPFDYY